MADCFPLALHRMAHWYNFIYKSICGLLPSYLSDSYRTWKEGILVFCPVLIGCITEGLAALSVADLKK